MKRALLSFLWCMLGYGVFSQKVYFIYLQTEHEQPFFVKMNDKAYNSSASGYLILSNLHDSTCTFGVGFPEEKWQEQRFSVKINAKDHGYLLKNFGEKGWGLFDLQTMAIQMSALLDTKQSAVIKTEKKEVSAFTDILSKAADDSTLKEKQVLVQEEKRSDAGFQNVVKREEKIPDTIVQSVVKKEPVKPEEKKQVKEEEINSKKEEQPIVKKEETNPIVDQPYKRSSVIKKSESSNTQGFGLVFIDEEQNGTQDTIRILIPNPKPVVNIVKQEPKEEKKFLDISTDTLKVVPKDTVVVNSQEIQKPSKDSIKEKKPESKQQENNKNVLKNNCELFASDSDFFALRKSMAARTEDDEMVDEAKKFFKTKCFSTMQIKNLSVLFLNDDGKYKFFDAAYFYVSDVENFGSLQAELKDEYYINRFKAMLR